MQRLYSLFSTLCSKFIIQTYLKKQHILILLLLVLGAPLYGQYNLFTGDDTYYLLPQDTIFLKIEGASEKIFKHKLAPGQTLFSLSKFYGLTINELYFYTPSLKNNPYNIGDPISIPIPNRAIKRFKGKYFEPSQYVPVCYMVERGDNLYHVSKRIFKLPLETVKEKNNLTSNTLSIGQVLNVGWMSIYGIPDSLRQFKGHPLWKRSFNNKKKYFYQKEDKKERETRGPALWIKGNDNSRALVVMHRKAKEGSIVGVTNPMNKRTVYAKVIGKIPYTYSADVEVIVSPTIAKMLGVLDEKFYARTHYLK